MPEEVRSARQGSTHLRVLRLEPPEPSRSCHHNMRHSRLGRPHLLSRAKSGARTQTATPHDWNTSSDIEDDVNDRDDVDTGTTGLPGVRDGQRLVGYIKKWYPKEIHSFGYIACPDVPNDVYVYGGEIGRHLGIKVNDLEDYVGQHIRFTAEINCRGVKAKPPFTFLSPQKAAVERDRRVFVFDPYASRKRHAPVFDPFADERTTADPDASPADASPEPRPRSAYVDGGSSSMHLRHDARFDEPRPSKAPHIDETGELRKRRREI